MSTMTDVHNPLSENFRPFVEKIVDTLVTFMQDERRESSEDNRVCQFVEPNVLEGILAPLRIEAEGASTEELLSNVKIILDNSVKTGHRHCLNQLFHRADGIAVIADWITAAVNTSIYTYETAPVGTLVEHQMIEEYRKLLTWDHAEGFFAPGGSTSNLCGIALGRDRAFPHVQREGWQAGDKPAVFVSKDGHYSTKKSCGLLGIGYSGCIGVETDARNRMCPEQLRIALAKAVAEGRTPTCIVVTSGSTLTGAADRVDEIIEVCKPYGVWVHVDGCFGGGVIHSPTHRWNLQGVENADSFAMNPHKMLGSTQQCAVFLTSQKGSMRKQFATNAAYLFNEDKQYDQSYDVGDSIFQCGRRVDCLKLWLMWRQRGDIGMAAYIDRAVKANVDFAAVVRSRKSQFRLMLDETDVVPATCFWWVPEEMSHIEDILDAELFDVVDYVVPRAKKAMMKSGYAVLTMSRMQGIPNFWRFIGNGGTDWTTKQFNEFLDQVHNACRQAYEKRSTSTPMSPAGQTPCCA